MRHGLTTSPDWRDVRSWYRIILDDATAEPDLLEPDPRHRAALSLAEAEARRDSAGRVEEAHLADMAERHLKRGQRSLEDLARLDLEDPETLEVLIAKETDPDMRKALRIFLETCPNRPVAMRDTLKRLTRYRRQAEARRRKALKAWIWQNTEDQKSETNPISSQG